MDDSDWTPPELHCRHLLVCRTIWYDPERPDDGFSLGKLVVRIRPEPTEGFPISARRLFVFAQLFGTPAEYRLRLRLVRIDRNALSEEVETPLGIDGDQLEFDLPRPLFVSGQLLVDAFAMPVIDVPFSTPGLYEFQLWHEDADEPLAGERLEVSE